VSVSVFAMSPAARVYTTQAQLLYTNKG